MNSLYCNDCQIFLAIKSGLCNKCIKKLKPTEENQSNKSKNLRQDAANFANTENFEKTTPIIENTFKYSSIEQEEVAGNNLSDKNQNKIEAESAENYQETDYLPLNILTDHQLNQYKKEQDETVEPSSFKSNFLNIKKNLIALSIVITGLSIFLLYSNSFSLKTVNEGPEAMNFSFIQLQPQTPWFSSWYRSNPNAEEIFDRFEEVTFAAGKNLKAERYYIKGRVFFAAPHNLESTFMKLQKGEKTDSFSEKYNPKSIEGPWNYNSTFEMYLKIPNKVVMKMEMTDKNPASKQPKIFVFAGSDGQNHPWSLQKTYIKGEKKIIEGNIKAFSSFSNNEKFIAMTFVREMYEKMGVLGVVVYAGRKNYHVKAFKPNGEIESLYFDIETGLINKVETKDAVICLFNYTLIDNVKMPASWLLRSGNDTVLLDIVEMQKDYLIDDSIFSISEYRK